MMDGGQPVGEFQGDFGGIGWCNDGGRQRDGS
jgi:hypothetical protein